MPSCVKLVLFEQNCMQISTTTLCYPLRNPNMLITSLRGPYQLTQIKVGVGTTLISVLLALLLYFVSMIYAYSIYRDLNKQLVILIVYTAIS